MAVRPKPGEPEDKATRQLGLSLVLGGGAGTVVVTTADGAGGSPRTATASPTPSPTATIATVAAPVMPAHVAVAILPGAQPPAVRAPLNDVSRSPAPPSPSPSPAANPPPPVPEAPRVFGVVELVRAARLTLESRFADVRVEGEISGFKRSGPGHLYFCLKDDQASLDCVMYGREASRLRFRPHDGMAVRVRGRLTIYEGRGRFQLTAVDLEPTGAGALAIAFEQLKQRLQAEGLFDAARKRKLPFLPRRVGVVTSPQGAVIRDIVRVVHRRSAVPVLLAPTAVQGPGAPLGIVAGIERLARISDVDVIIVARGGGSLEDLWSFNEEIVARAISACPVPVISAVGHETDFTIADFVADLRAPTPSAAAELAVPVATDLRAELAVLVRRAGRATEAQLRHARLVLERCGARVGEPRRLLDDRRQLLDELASRAQRCVSRRIARGRADLAAIELTLSRTHPHRRIADQRAALTRMREVIARAVRRELQRRRSPVDSLAHKLDALSPRRVLDRGYSLAFGPDGHLLTDAAAVAAGEGIRVALRRGELAATVTSHEAARENATASLPGDSEAGTKR